MDPAGSLPDHANIDDKDAVVVPEIQSSLDQAQIQEFKLRMSGVNGAGPWDMEPYLYAMQTLHEILDEAVADV